MGIEVFLLVLVLVFAVLAALLKDPEVRRIMIIMLIVSAAVLGLVIILDVLGVSFPLSLRRGL